MGSSTTGAGRNAIAWFASGCFWSKEYFFSQLEGVQATRAGFMGGHLPEPTYRQVCSKTTGHAETVEVVFDPDRLSYAELVRHFFNWHNPTIDRRDKGGQYRSAIFYADRDQQATARHLIRQLEDRGLRVVTELEEAGTFWPAEARHQGYCERNGFVPEPRIDRA